MIMTIAWLPDGPLLRARKGFYEVSVTSDQHPSGRTWKFRTLAAAKRRAHLIIDVEDEDLLAYSIAHPFLR